MEQELHLANNSLNEIAERHDGNWFTLVSASYILAQTIQALYSPLIMIFTFNTDYKDHRYKCSTDGMEYLQLNTFMQTIWDKCAHKWLIMVMYHIPRRG